MEDYVDMLEHEFESAVEVKDKNSLHRAVRLIAENTVGRKEYDSGIGELKSDVRLIAERMEQGFKRMDERFEAVDKRFESMQTQMNQRFEAVDKRFDEVNGKFRMQTAFFGLGFTILSAVMVLLKLFIV